MSYIHIPNNIVLPQTPSLPVKLKLCVGVRLMLTNNISVSDRLSNGSIIYYILNIQYTQLIPAYSVLKKPRQVIGLQNMDEILDNWNWKDIHESTQHDLALYYSVSKVNIIEVIEIPSVLEVLSFLLKI